MDRNKKWAIEDKVETVGAIGDNGGWMDGQQMVQ